MSAKDESRKHRINLLASLNKYEEFLEHLVAYTTDPVVAVQIFLKGTPSRVYGPDQERDYSANELFSPGLVELRAMVQAQITKLRSELQDLI